MMLAYFYLEVIIHEAKMGSGDLTNIFIFYFISHETFL